MVLLYFYFQSGQCQAGKNLVFKVIIVASSSADFTFTNIINKIFVTINEN